MHLVDLTYPLDERTPVYPGDPFFRRTVVCDHETDGFRVTDISFGSHSGTHLDAPLHFFLDGEPLDALELARFFPFAAVCDLTPYLTLGKTAYPPKIMPEMLAPFSPILEQYEAVIFRTGWGAYWQKNDYFTHFPSILPETAEWLADFPFRLLGLDTPSLSAYGNTLFNEGTDWGGDLDEALLHSDAESHRILLGRQPPVLLLENLANLDQLPAVHELEEAEVPSFRLACFPLSVTGADGFPVRACAVFD